MPPSTRVAVAILLTVGTVALLQQVWVSPTNFGGADEWLILDLSSRGILGLPYANRPLVLLWQTPAAFFFPGSLWAFWLLEALYFVATGCLTAWLALRLAPGEHVLALLAGTVAVAWTPLDFLRLDTVMACGYGGGTATVMAAVVLWVESWHRKRPAILALGMVLGALTCRGGEVAIPVLAVAPALLWSEARVAPRRFAAWTLAWEAMVAICAGAAAAPLLSGRPSYQSNAIGLDLSPLGIGTRLLQLIGMQIAPLLSSDAGELAAVAVPAVVGVFLSGLAFVWRSNGRTSDRATELRALVPVFVAGLSLALAAHSAFALTAAIRTPARTQMLSAPGLALALGTVIVAASRLTSPRWHLPLVALLGGWVVAVGTGRLVAMQTEWDSSRNAYPGQARTLKGLTSAAPGLEPGSLVLLLDDDSWPNTFTFRHALRYLYGEGVVGVVDRGADFLYPWQITAQGIAVFPWPEIRGEWWEGPSFHSWETILVVRLGENGSAEILSRWPNETLPPLPPGARYAPAIRVRTRPARERERGVLDTASRLLD